MTLAGTGTHCGRETNKRGCMWERLLPLLMAVIAALTFPLTGALAQSPGWNLYSGYSNTFTIHYAHEVSFKPGDVPELKVNVEIGGQPIQVQVDTGSQGIVVPVSLFGGSLNCQVLSCTPGTIAYSSSNNSATGYWVTMPVKFTNSSDANGNVGQATVPVFVEMTANNASCATPGNSCFSMMGVGFGRPDAGWTGYLPSLDANPLLHLQGMDAGTVRAGYIITTTGIQAGLTATNANQGYSFIQLQPSVIPLSSPNWQTPTGTLVYTSDGTTTTTTLPVLVDTGITYLWGNLGNTTNTCVYRGTTYGCSPTNTAVSVTIGGGGSMGYSYVVGASDNNSAAPAITRTCDPQLQNGTCPTAPNLSLNTGITPLSQFNLLFDAVGGFAGFQAVAPGTPGTVFTPTLVTGGSLSLAGGFFTTLPVYVADPTTLSTTGNILFSGAFSGPGALTFAGPGSATFASPLTLPGLTLAGGQATFLADVTAPTVVIASGASVSNAATLTGALSNAGSLLNTGAIAGRVSNSGLLTNTGTMRGEVVSSGAFFNTGTVNGAVTSSGLLSLDGTVAGHLTNTGTLMGNGTVIGTLTNGGLVAPGHSIGTLNVTGNAVFQAGSTYQAEIGPNGTSDLIAVTGSATIATGATLLVTPYGAYTPSFGSYSILTASGGITGAFTVSAPAFGSLAAAYPFLGATTSSANGQTLLTIGRSSVPFAAAGLTANQIAAGQGLDRLFTATTLSNAAAVGLNAITAPAAYDQLSGEIYASMQSILLEESLYVRDGVLGRLRQASSAPGANGLGAAQTAPLVPGLPLTLWAEGYGGWGQTSGTGNSAGDSRSMGGFLMGLDAPLGSGWQAGFAGGYSQTSFSIGARNSSGSSDNYDVALYAGGPLGYLGTGALQLRTGAAYAWHDLAVSRSVAFSGFANALTSGSGASTAQVFAELGYALDLSGTALAGSRIEPFAGLFYVHVGTDGLTETGGTAALSVASASFDTTATQLGVRASTVLRPGPTAAGLDLHGMIGWQHDFGGTVPLSTASFATGGLPFTVAGAPIAADSLLLGLGIDALIGPNTRFGVSYTGQLANAAQENALKGNLSIRF